MIGFRSVFSRLFASVFIALAVFAVAMFVWIQVAHNNSDTFNQRVIARKIALQIEPFLLKAEEQTQAGNRVQARYSLVVIKKTFDIFDESLNAKIGLYNHNDQLMLQTNDSGLPERLLHKTTWFNEVMPSLWGASPQHVQVKTPSGYTIWYESRTVKEVSYLSGIFNLFTGTVLLFGIMSFVLWLIAKNMTSRLNALSRQMIKMGEGDFSARVKEVGNDEITLLAHGFNQSAQKIEQLINANNLLLAHASHEFRTPITRMRLQTEMLSMLGDNLPTAQKSLLEKRTSAINKDLNGLNDLIESILLVSRLDAGHVLEQMQEIDFYELILEECQHFEQATLYGEPVNIQAQPKLLTHLIRNLLNNALIHGTPPMTIYVYGCQTSDETATIPERLLRPTSLETEKALDIKEADNKEQSNKELSPKARISKERDKFLNRFKKPTPEKSAPAPTPPNFVVLAVLDEGTGIPVDKREDIFSPFVRLKQEKKGSGLGLSLVAQIVEMHHGKILTDTWQGKTRFLAVLPVKQKALPKQ